MPFLDDIPQSKLEADYQQPFEAWKAKPTPTTTGALLRALSPEIKRGISAHAGADNPLLHSRARKLTLQALQSYDPNKAKLGTHIVNHLQGLRRVNRQQTQILRVPERVSMEQGYLNQAQLELTDQLGREPTITELADHTSLSPKRIAYIQRFRPAIAESAWLHASDTDEDNVGDLPSVNLGNDTWVEAVYYDMDETNRKIMEWSLGLHGQRVLPNQVIARRLRITPGAVSQRKSQIQAVLNRQQELSPF